MHRNLSFPDDNVSSLDQFKDLDAYLTHHGGDKTAKVKSSTEFPPQATLFSRLGIDVLCVLGVILIALIGSSFLLRGDTPIYGTSSGVMLGARGYELQDIHASSLSGFMLSMTSKFLSSSRFGPW